MNALETVYRRTVASPNGPLYEFTAGRFRCKICGQIQDDHAAYCAVAQFEYALAAEAKKPEVRASVSPVSEWQPIASCPRGTMVLMCCMLPTIEARQWAFVDWLVDGKCCDNQYRRPTHWMPLPLPPAAPQEKQ